jgi:transcriptional regulator with GAF, ATPase, and Fis domain
MEKIRIDHRGLKSSEGVKEETPVRPNKKLPYDRDLGRTQVTPTLKSNILTQDARLIKIMDLIPLYAKTDLPVFIMGEPGTGKELVAEALWTQSIYGKQDFIKINCATMQESMANSELFGHVRGAFTDAHRTKRGKFELAHQGTLFLDEIGDLPLSVQPRLLRAVEQGEIEPVGSETPVKVEVRLIAATNQNLRSLIPQGRFRQDLYDRLSTLLIILPPLRERPGDVLLLAQYFANKTAQTYGLGPVCLSPGVVKKLEAYHWPGNVRELKNIITRAVLLRQQNEPEVKDLGTDFDPSPPEYRERAPHSAIPTLPTRPAREEMKELLRTEQGNISAISRRLKVCTKTIYRWLKHYDIELDNFRHFSAGSG